MSLTRRTQIYGLAQKHDLIIFEDDPYYFLQLPALAHQSTSLPDLLHIYGHATLVPSLLSLDTDGRVIRFDSFAKIVAPGLRLGWVSGSQQLMDRYSYFNEVSIQAPSGLSQAVLGNLLMSHWDGYRLELHIAKIRMEFTRRRDAVINLLRPVKGWLVDFVTPMAGMFLWIQPRLPNLLLTMDNGTMPSQRTLDDLFQALVDEHIVLVPGRFFDTELNDVGSSSTMHQRGDNIVGANYFRLCFTYADLDRVLLGVRRFIYKLEALHN